MSIYDTALPENTCFSFERRCKSGEANIPDPKADSIWTFNSAAAAERHTPLEAGLAPCPEHTGHTAGSNRASDPATRSPTGAETLAKQAVVPTRRLLLRWKVFAFGFGLSLPLLILEYLTEGGFPGWIILVPTNPTTLAAALVAHGVEPLLGPRWSNEAFFGTFILESAVWWYLVAGLVDLARRRRKTRVSVTSASSATDAEARNLTKPQPAHSPPESARRDERAK